MKRIIESPVGRYGFALAITFSALFSSLLLRPVVEYSAFLFFYGAVTLSTWFGGLLPGFLSILVSVAAVNYFFIPPLYTFEFTLSDILRAFTLTTVMLFIYWISESHRRAIEHAHIGGERFSTTLASIGDAVIATDIDGHVTFINPIAEQLTGWSGDEALGKPLTAVFRIVNEETRQPVESPTVRVLRDGAVVGLANHTLLIRKDGTEIHIDDNSTPIRDKDGGIQGAVLVFHDVTARRKLEQQQQYLIRASEELASSLDLEQIFEVLKHLLVPEITDWYAVGLIGDDGYSIYYPSIYHPDQDKQALATAITAGYPINLDTSIHAVEAIQTGKTQFVPKITPDNIDHIPDAFVQDASRRLQLRSAMHVPLTARGKKLGSLTLMRGESGQDFRQEDLPLAEELGRRIALAIDNAQLYREAQQQREQLRVSLTSIGDAVIATDTQERVTFINPVAGELTGWTPQEAVGQPLTTVFNIINETSREKVESPVTEVLREGRIVGLANHTLLIAPDGRETPIDDSGAPITDDAGNISGVILVFRDITEQKRTEAAQRFLDESTQVLSSSLDYQVTLQNIARLVVPALADWYSLSIPSEDGQLLEHLLVHHTDPQMEKLADTMLRLYPVPIDAPLPSAEAYRTGKTILVPDIPPEMIDSIQDEFTRTTLHRLKLRSVMNVPLAARGQKLGMLVLNTAESGRRFSPKDTPLIEELCRRIAIAIDNARLYREAEKEIQHRKQVENELRKSEEQLRLITDSLPVIISYVDQQERYQFNNRVYEEWFGTPREQITGKTVREVVGDEAYQVLQSRIELALSGQIVNFEDRVSYAPNNSRYVSVTYIPDGDERGHVRGFFALVSDISERKKAEDARAFLVEVSRVLGASLHYENILDELPKLVVPQFADFCTLTTLGRDSNLPPAIINPSDTIPVESAYRAPFYLEAGLVDSVLASGDVQFMSLAVDGPAKRSIEDNSQSTNSGSFGSRSIVLAPMIAHNRKIGVICLGYSQSGRTYSESDVPLIRELANRTALAIDNAQLYKRAQQAVALRDEFLSVAAHELKTPVTSLRGFAGVILRQIRKGQVPEAERLQSILEALDAQGERLGRLINHLLDVTNIESGQLRLHRMVADVGAIIHRVVQIAKEATQLHFFELELGELLTANIDPLRIEQVVTNLVDNAIKFSPNGGVIRIQASAYDDRRIRIAVTDHGVGVPPEHRQRLFERYYRVPDRYYQGMGLGLYTSRQIVELHGGQISAEFPDDGGMCVVVYLPCGDDSPD
jgi:PAS domain S-box-containing protein